MRLRRFSENRLFLHLIAFFVSFLLVFTRRRDAILNPQFWAEDGKHWYAEAYNNGVFISLLTPLAGYFQTLSRLTGIVAQLVPFSAAPLLFNIVAITCKILVVNLLISNRYAELIPNKILRFLIALIYLALPNSYEVHANLTNAQWHLALLACLIILASPSRRFAWRLFDVAVVMLSVLSGPLCLFLLPVAGMQYWRTKQRWIFYLLCIVFAGVLIQGFSLLILTGTVFNRTDNVGLGATPELFFKIIGGQVFLASLIGQNLYSVINSQGAWTFFPSVVMTLLGFSVLGYSIWKGTPEFRLFLLFGGLICLGALLSPVVVNDQPQWQALWRPFVGNRYWFIPMIGFVLSLIFIVAQAQNRYWRFFAGALLLLLSFGIVKDWRLPPYKDLQFKEHAQKLAEAPIGAKIEIPINPNWTMELIKK